LFQTLAPITDCDYSNRFGEKSWTIVGEFGGRKTSVSFRIEVVRGQE
jgi:hypothetical protein